MAGSPVAQVVVMGVVAMAGTGVVKVGWAGGAETAPLAAVEAQPEGVKVEAALASQEPAGSSVVMAAKAGARVEGEMVAEAKAEAVPATGAPWVAAAMEAAGKELRRAGWAVETAVVATVAAKEEGGMVAETVVEASA